MAAHGYERTGSPPTDSEVATPWRPAFRKAGRSSLGALETQHANAIRREAFSSIYTSSPAAFTSFNNIPANIPAQQTPTGRGDTRRRLVRTREEAPCRQDSGGGDSNKQNINTNTNTNTKRKSSSPPTSMSSGGRLQRHQRSYSASAAVHSSNHPPATSYTLSTKAHQLQHQYQQQLQHRPPVRLLRVPTRFTAPKTSTVDMATTTETQHHARINSLDVGAMPAQSNDHSSTSHDLLHEQQQQQQEQQQEQQPSHQQHQQHQHEQYTSLVQQQPQQEPPPQQQPQQPPQQSTADFVMRTQRASARARQGSLGGTNPQLNLTATPLVSERMPAVNVHYPTTAPRSVDSSSTATASNTTAVPTPTPTSRDSVESRRVPLSSRTSFESAGTSPFDSPRPTPSTGWTTPMTSPLGSPRWDGAPKGYGPPDLIPARLSRKSWEAGQMQMQQQGYQWHRPAPIKRRQPRKQGELFAMLPGEVLELIVEEVKQAHLWPGSGSCATCWMRDACNIAISCRKWHKYARAALYEDIQLVGAENALWKKKYKLTDGARLVLLRRTLRMSPQIAAIVHSLKVPSQPASMAVESYHSLAASVVMACPNLERLVGFYPSYNGTFNRLFHALSTRPRLKQMDWIVEPSPVQRHGTRSRPGSSANLASILSKRAGPGNSGAMDASEMKAPSFLEYHSSWMYLSSLTVHCQPGSSLLPETFHPSTFSKLPALQSLYLSNLPPSVCNDGTLLDLPPLKSLSLSNLPGITSMGLSSFVAHSAGQPITTLTLRNIDLVSLPVLARIVSNLPKLRTLNIVQPLPPVLPKDEVIWLFPYLASKTLHTLHWDITSGRPTGPANEADSILARSIAANGFPSLRAIRVPNDGDGLFQALCKPRGRIDLPTDRFRLPAQGYGSRPSLSSDGTRSGTNGRPSISSSTSGGSLKKTHTVSSSSKNSSPTTSPVDAARNRVGSDLIAARLAAQSRMEAAYRVPKFLVNVVDEDGTVNENFGIGGHIGTVGSMIKYHLLSDEGASDETGGLVEVADMLGKCGEDISVGPDGIAPEGCTGKWNTWSGAMMTADRKERERWYHTERGRWRPVRLS